jgi:hypothetical protein
VGRRFTYERYIKTQGPDVGETRDLLSRARVRHNIMGNAQLPIRMSMNETAARRVMLAEAIETADTQGKILTPFERDQIDRAARKAAGVGGEASQPVAADHFIDVRAQHVLAAVGVRHPALVALQGGQPWLGWMSFAAPAVAIVLGVVTDAVANPHRVDLVSLPLLGIVGWNLLMYLVMLFSWILARDGGGRPFLAGLGRWADGERALRRRPGHLHTQVAALFHLRWYEATERLHIQRVKRVLHLSAAGWAVGIALSLLARGLVVEYRVGWESTFLGAEQVHGILSVLRLPALLLFPFESFSVQEVAALQFSRGGGAVAGARWVYMYVALLLVTVVAPRMVLAGVAHWRARMLSNRVPLGIEQPYYRRLASLLHSARVELLLLTHREEDRAAVLRVLMQAPEAGTTLIRSAQDDVLRLRDVSGMRAPANAPSAESPSGGWGGRLLALFAPAASEKGVPDPELHAAREEGDVVLHVVSQAEHDPVEAQPLLRWLDKPVLVLGNAAPGQPGVPGSLSFESFARCWVQERVLLDAVGRLMPEEKQAGFARLATAWDERNNERFTRSMAALAEHLMFAARQTEEARTGAVTVRNLMPSERQVQAQARQQAMDAVVQRLNSSATQLFARLRKLHGVDDDAAETLQQALERKFVVQQSVDTPQAGVAGAATGAAMGASVDLMVGGLTLGAATALGALVGGSAAFIAAAWKNRATASGSTVVQLSDEMMQAMVEAELLRYLAVAHFGRGAAGPQAEAAKLRWKDEVVAAVESSRSLLTPFWNAARIQPDVGRLSLALARELESIAAKVLGALYPGQIRRI